MTTEPLFNSNIDPDIADSKPSGDSPNEQAENCPISKTQGQILLESRRAACVALPLK